jgi:hypothetical protein
LEVLLNPKPLQLSSVASAAGAAWEGRLGAASGRGATGRGLGPAEQGTWTWLPRPRLQQLGDGATWEGGLGRGLPAPRGRQGAHRRRHGRAARMSAPPQVCGGWDQAGRRRPPRWPPVASLGAGAAWRWGLGPHPEPEPCIRYDLTGRREVGRASTSSRAGAFVLAAGPNCEPELRVGY